MFLIYNFHLVESYFSTKNTLMIISEILQRDLSDFDYKNIIIYGSEAFLLSCLSVITDSSLKRNWCRINQIWTILNSDYLKQDSWQQKHYIHCALNAWNLKKYSVVSSSLDHCIKFIKMEKKIEPKFFDLLNLVCCLMIKFLEQKTLKN